jgi:hypothetical protein
MSALDMSASAKIGSCPMSYVLLDNNEVEIRFHGTLPGWGLDLHFTEHGLRRFMSVGTAILDAINAEKRTADVTRETTDFPLAQAVS